MRISFLVILICLFSLPVLISKPLYKPLETENNIGASKIFVDAKKNVYITGSFTGIVRFSKNLVLGSYGSEDIFLAKYDAEGNCLWASNAGSNGVDGGQSIIADETGYVYLTGYYSGNALFGQTMLKGGAQQNFFVAQYNPSGDPVWIRTGVGKEPSSGSDIKLDKSKNCYVSGSFSNSISISKKNIAGIGGNDILFLKFSSKGDLIWGKALGGKEDDVVHSSSLQVDGNNLYISGSFNDKLTIDKFSTSSNGLYDAFLAKFNLNGEIQWLQSWGGVGIESGSGICTDKEGNIYLVGNYDTSFSVGKNPVINKGLFDVFYVKLNSNGSSQSMQYFGTGGNERCTSCSIDQLGNLYIAGCFKYDFVSNDSYSNEETLGNDLFIVKYKGTLKDKWSLLAGGNGDDGIIDMCSDQENNIYALGLYHGRIKIGKTELTNSGGNELFFAKINSAGSYSFVKKAVSPEPNYSDKTKYVNYYAKLMLGKEKSSLVDQVVNLKSTNGEMIQTTKTDMYGDFSFRGISTAENVNIVLEENENIPFGESIFLADQKGKITKELAKDKNNDFAFDILSSELMQLTVITEEDNANKLKKFKTGKETEVTITENILYEPGEWSVSADNAVIINKLAQTMRLNLNYNIEIHSYTDAIGDAQANMALSEKRAQSIVDFFVKKSIKPERIKGSGFGETKILNRCTDGVECSEREHQTNRRTEFKFIKDKK